MLGLAWLFASAGNFFLGIFIIFVIVLILNSNLADDGGKRPVVEMAVVAGDENECEELAAKVKSADRLELVESPQAAFEQIIRRKMVLVFIVKAQISGFSEQVIMHLQRACDKLEETSDLSSLKYAIFGIGDTAREEFNSMALSLDLNLRKLGARSVTPMHLFDVVTSEFGLDDEFVQFIEKISPGSVVVETSPAPELIESKENSEESEGVRHRNVPQPEQPKPKETPSVPEVTKPVIQVEEIDEVREESPEPLDKSETTEQSEAEDKSEDWEIMDPTESLS